jgi:hypothetical protein
VLFGRDDWRHYWHFCFILRRWGVSKTARTTRGQYARHPITHLIIVATLTPPAPQYNTTLVSWRWTRLWQQCFMRGDRMVWLKLEFNLIYCRFWWFPIMTWTRCFVWLLDGASYHSF